MFIFLILFFIIYILSVVFFYYKLKLQDDEIEEMYSQLYSHIKQDFKIGGMRND